jgi:hypothetical protein
MERVVTELERYVDKQQVQRRESLKLDQIYDLIANVRGSVMMAYPMGLPEHDITKQLLDYIAITHTHMMTTTRNNATDGQPAVTDNINSTAQHKSNDSDSDKPPSSLSCADYVSQGKESGASNKAKDTPRMIPGLLDSKTTTLWAAGKEFRRGQLVCDRLGGSRNEKTKLIAKLQAVGQATPGREPAVSQDEQHAMMAYYHKRQEQLKRLAESEEDDYLHSAWADPKGLKNNLHQLNDTIKAPGVYRGL